MKGSTRRCFLLKSTLVGLGAAAARAGLPAGDNAAETALRAVDVELLEVLRSYGRVEAMSRTGTRELVVRSRRCGVPAYRIEVEVRDTRRFCRSFAALSRTSDRVLVSGNTLNLARQRGCFLIENRVV
jgi:hypothetical protein